MSDRTSRAVLSASIVAFAIVGCTRTQPLTKEAAVALIEESSAFRSPIDPGIVFVDAQYHPGPNTKRELVRLEGLVLKDDGPGGIAGQTATAVFTWRWNEGPFANRLFRSKAKLNNNGSGWRAYNDYLKKQLYAGERGEEE
jgi:hypothetical protein